MDSEKETAEMSGVSRRRMLQIMGAGAGAAALGGMMANSASAIENPFPFTPRGRLKNRPNFLVVVVDEMRFAPFMNRPNSLVGVNEI